MENSSKTTHPLILVAAASVTVASLAAAAHFTGLLPNRAAEATPGPVAAVSAPAPAPALAPPAKTEAPVPVSEAPRPAAKPPVHRTAREAPRPHRQPDYEPVRQREPRDEGWRYEGGTQRISTNNAGIDVIPSSRTPVVNTQPAQVPAAAPAICHDCGTVESVREVSGKGEGSGLGAIAGGVLGGVLGHQVGRGTGKDLATIAGAVGGAVAGHQVEKNVRGEKEYQVSVRFEDGSVRSYTLPNAGWQSGDRVRQSNGSLVSLNSR